MRWFGVPVFRFFQVSFEVIRLLSYRAYCSKRSTYSKARILAQDVYERHPPAPRGERTFTLLIDAWANVNRGGDYNIVHTHPNCMWSGVYYVALGEPDKSVP